MIFGNNFTISAESSIVCNKRIVFGDNVWIGCETIILKGAKIPSGCVVGARSLLNKVFKNKNCLIAGNPAEEIKRDISWEY